MDYLILVNKENPLYTNLKLDLIKVGKNHDNEYVYMEKLAGLSLMRMLDDVNKLFPFEKVVVNSGYRSISKQEAILKYYLEKEGSKAYERVALPKTSEHHTGLAIDVSVIKNGIYIEDPTGIEKSLKWLYENAYKYGFILRYPLGKESVCGYMYEPWHFRYIGFSKLAFEMKKNNLTLEEYVLEKNKSLQ